MSAVINMSIVVCQGLKSCLESPQNVKSRTLRLKLASPKPHFSHPLELALKPSISYSNPIGLVKNSHCDETTKNTSSLQNNPSSTNMSGWSFIQALTTLSPTLQQPLERENSYVHPLDKHSSSVLSEKSLELCTENLGSESGSDIVEGNIFLFSSSDEDGKNSYPTTREQPKRREYLGAKKARTTRSFPPPLTMIRGTKSLRFKPTREDGRLVIKAVKTPLQTSLFQAERSNGHLRLSFLNNNADSNLFVAEENDEKIEENEMEISENEAIYEEEEEEEEEEKEEDEVKEESDVLLSEDMNGNDMDDGVRIGMRNNYQRHSRCKEGRHGKNEVKLNLEPFLGGYFLKNLQFGSLSLSIYYY